LAREELAFFEARPKKEKELEVIAEKRMPEGKTGSRRSCAMCFGQREKEEEVCKGKRSTS